MRGTAAQVVSVLALMAASACFGNLPDYAPRGAQVPRFASRSQESNPGTVTLHRLNKLEYNNTVRDLLNTMQTPADALPADATTFGFDNIADALTISDSAVRVYQQSAEALAAEASDPKGPEYARLVTCDPNVVGAQACLSQVAADFAYYAWRRPVTVTDVAGIVAAASAGNPTFSQQVSNVVATTLLAPEFLYRVELDPKSSPGPRPLTDHELASRLSYFLWSSMPDDELFAVADNHTLHTDAVLLQQTHRMLADPKARALAESFAGQWLELRGLAVAAPSTATYPHWDEGLRAAMLGESVRFFTDFLTTDAPISQLLTARYTYLNDRLAQHYGLPPPGSAALQRVALPDDSPRGGILTQGAWLTTQAHADRSGVVSRGKFVLGKLLCSPPPAPPPGIPPLSAASGFMGTQRQHLDAHVSSPACASCHSAMDPLGYAFEAFDGIGEQRTIDNGFPVDTSGLYGDKTPFSGARDLVNLVAEDPRFSACLVSNLFTYALGRGPTDADKPTLAAMTASFVKRDSSLPKLIDMIVSSDAFRMRGPSSP